VCVHAAVRREPVAAYFRICNESFFFCKSQAICSPGDNLLLYSLKCCDNVQTKQNKTLPNSAKVRCVSAHDPSVPSHFIGPTLLQLIFTRL